MPFPAEYNAEPPSASVAKVGAAAQARLLSAGVGLVFRCRAVGTRGGQRLRRPGGRGLMDVAMVRRPTARIIGPTRRQGQLPLPVPSVQNGVFPLMQRTHRLLPEASRQKVGVAAEVAFTV